MKITDKMRLDWLNRQIRPTLKGRIDTGWTLRFVLSAKKSRTVRQANSVRVAIDMAIRAEAKGKK